MAALLERKNAGVAARDQKDREEIKVSLFRRFAQHHQFTMSGMTVNDDGQWWRPMDRQGQGRNHPNEEPDASGGRAGLVESWGAPEGSLRHRLPPAPGPPLRCSTGPLSADHTSAQPLHWATLRVCTRPLGHPCTTHCPTLHLLHCRRPRTGWRTLAPHWSARQPCTTGWHEGRRTTRVGGGCFGCVGARHVCEIALGLPSKCAHQAVTANLRRLQCCCIYHPTARPVVCNMPQGTCTKSTFPCPAHAL